MRKHIFHFILFLLSNLISDSLFSQSDSVSGRLNYGIGYSHSRTLDTQNSPLVYKGHLIEGSFGIERTRLNKSIWNSRIQIQGGFATPKNIDERSVYNNYYDINGEYNSYINKIKHTEFQFNLSTAYLYKIPYSNMNIELYAGGDLHEYLYLNYLSTWGLDMPSVLNDFSISPEFYIVYHWKNNFKINLNLSFPVLGLISRLPYSNVPSIDKYNPFIAIFESGTRFVTILQYQKIDLTIGLQKAFNKKWTGKIMYNFMWFHYPEEFDIDSYRNSVEVIFSRKLKNKK